VLQYRSQNSDVFYRITYESGNYKLNCYKVVDQSSSPNPTLQIQNFSTTAEKSWEIKAVSLKGRCVAVQQKNSLTTYTTDTGSFLQAQSISTTNFGSNVEYNVNDDCSIIRVNTKDSLGAVSTKVFQNEVEMDSLVLPQGSLFTSDFTYAIDTASNFYQISSGSYVSKKITQLKTAPLYIKWSSILKALITVSMDSNGYSIYVIDPAN
jgi:hypothetical protein